MGWENERENPQPRIIPEKSDEKKLPTSAIAGHCRSIAGRGLNPRPERSTHAKAEEQTTENRNQCLGGSLDSELHGNIWRGWIVPVGGSTPDRQRGDRNDPPMRKQRNNRQKIGIRFVSGQCLSGFGVAGRYLAGVDRSGRGFNPRPAQGRRFNPRPARNLAIGGESGIGRVIREAKQSFAGTHSQAELGNDRGLIFPILESVRGLRFAKRRLAFPSGAWERQGRQGDDREGGFLFVGGVGVEFGAWLREWLIGWPGFLRMMS